MNIEIEFWYWIVLGLLLIGLEMVVPTFFLLWIGVSATLVGILSALTHLSFTAQLGLWGGLSILQLLAWFKWIQPKLKDKTQSGMTREAVIGIEGLVLSFNNDTQQGRIRFTVPIAGNDEWHIRSNDVLEKGDRAQVIDFSGNDLLVKKSQPKH